MTTAVKLLEAPVERDRRGDCSRSRRRDARSPRPWTGRSLSVSRRTARRGARHRRASATALGWRRPHGPPSTPSGRFPGPRQKLGVTLAERQREALRLATRARGARRHWRARRGQDDADARHPARPRRQGRASGAVRANGARRQAARRSDGTARRRRSIGCSRSTRAVGGFRRDERHPLDVRPRRRRRVVDGRCPADARPAQALPAHAGAAARR